MNTQPELIGHNLPPEKADPLRDRLYEDYADLIARRDELLSGFINVPEKIEDGDEDTAGKLADFIKKQIAEFKKRAAAVHENEKAPFLAAGRTCDSFKHTLLDDIEKGLVGATAVLKSYADRKAAIERTRREKEARIKREEAEEARRKADAEEAERRKVAAEEQRVRDEEEAKEQRAAAEVQRIADEAVKKMKDEADFKAAQERQADADRIDRQNKARGIEREREKKRTTAAAAAQAKTGQAEVKRTENVAIKADRSAGAKPAELGKSRGEYGGQTSLKQFWNYTDLDRDRIDLEALRGHIPHDALEKAVKSWIKANADLLAGGTELFGVSIYEDTRL